MESKDEYLLKICVIGSPGKLKTEFIRNFAEGKFPTDYFPTLGVDITTKIIQVDENAVKLILVDTASQEFFGKSRPSYYRNASACIICFEKIKIGLKGVTDWYNEFRKHCLDPNTPITLLCFDTGAEEITTEEGQRIANELGANYYELSPRPKPRYLDERREDAKYAETIFRDLTRRALATKEN
jgi:Ras-related protein Rab-32/Rab family protein